MQPLIRDDKGVIRFKANAIVRYLLERGPFDMTHLLLQEFSDEDRMQFAQLIGYSLSGYAELEYVSDESYEAAESLANQIAQAESVPKNSAPHEKDADGTLELRTDPGASG